MIGSTISSIVLVATVVSFSTIFVASYFILVRPTWRAAENEKSRWRRIWNHVDIILLVTWMVAIAAAIPEGAKVLSVKMTDYNDRLAEEGHIRITKRATYFYSSHCSPPATEIAGMCGIVSELLETENSYAVDWVKLIDVLSTERDIIKQAESNLSPWVFIEAQNLVYVATEISNYAGFGDRIGPLEIGPPLPWQVLAFWPVLVAFGFALALAKLIAAYRLI